MKLNTKYFIPCFSLLVLSYSLSAQTHAIDSIRSLLKTEKDDTSKVMTLDILGVKLFDQGKYDSSIAYDIIAESLAKKIGYKKGTAMVLNAIGTAYLDQGDYSKALSYFDSALDINTKILNKTGIGHNLGNIGLINMYEGHYEEALEYDFKALALYQDMGDKFNTAIKLGSIGVVYYQQGKYPAALQYYLKALAIDEEMGSKRGIASDLCNMGLVYTNQENYNKALEDFLKALAINQEIDNKRGISTDLGNIGNVYSSQNNYPKALEYELKTLDIDKEIGDKAGVASDLNSIGNIYKEQKNYDKALESYLKSLGIDRAIGDLHGIAAELDGIGNVYFFQKKYKQSHTYLDSALNLSKQIGEKEYIKDVYSNMGDLDSATGNYKEALQDYKNYIVFRDSLVNEANTKKTVQAEMNFEFEKKQTTEKAEQDKKDAIASQEKKKQLVIRNSFIGGFALMFALAFFIFRGYRQKQKANIIITQQKEEVEKQKALVEHQKALVEEKNRDILDSITYAKRLQDAILPPLSLIKQYLPESFVFYKPKDIVAGDFYWLERAGDTVILIAAADCTGHGVPGALVSVVCSNALNRTVKEFKITEPGKILDKVRELVLETFEKSESNVQDGMDISLCCINTKTNEIQWSGAYNSLWYIQQGEIKEVVANKQPIGKTDKPIPFNTHKLQLQKGDTLYLFTDGYADQFGGPKGKKFKYKQFEEMLLANSKKPMPEQEKILEHTLNEWKGELEQIDDILIIGIRV